MPSSPIADPEIVKRVKQWPHYVEAKLGFRNHWYPTFLSKELREGEPQAIRVLGDRILFNRIDGRVYAIRDRCLHRGVPLSRKPECYTKGTITCWYHAWTYRFDTGELCAILTSPQSGVIGTRNIKTFPVREEKGLVFVFVGDQEPPDLASDVPPTFLDPDMAICGLRRPVASNWRIGVENGFDSTHVFIHKDSVLVGGNDIVLPLGFAPTGKDAFRVVDEPTGPKGVYDLLGEHSRPVFEGRIDGNVAVSGHPEGSKRVANNISIWLPCVLRVQPWPDPSLTQFEWYVPEDADNHWYIQTLGRRVKNDAERIAFEEEFENKWEDLALRGFNDDDIWAREATQDFYRHDRAWIEEQLFEPDRNIVEWRKLASRRNRGVQTPDHLF